MANATARLRTNPRASLAVVRRRQAQHERRGRGHRRPDPEPETENRQDRTAPRLLGRPLEALLEKGRRFARENRAGPRHELRDSAGICEQREEAEKDEERRWNGEEQRVRERLRCRWYAVVPGGRNGAAQHSPASFDMLSHLLCIAERPEGQTVLLGPPQAS